MNWIFLTILILFTKFSFAQTVQNEIEEILENGHDWAQDHISEAKNNMDQVFDFLMNE